MELVSPSSQLYAWDVLGIPSVLRIRHALTESVGTLVTAARMLIAELRTTSQSVLAFKDTTEIQRSNVPKWAVDLTTSVQDSTPASTSSAWPFVRRTLVLYTLNATVLTIGLSASVRLATQVIQSLPV